ncbi:MAG: hypothetical protein ABI655_07405 [Phenylobacterium sp.]
MAFGFGKKRDGKIGPATVKEVVGKLFNAPNTALGVAYGGLGHVVGEAMGTHPHVAVRDNAIQFLNNPFGGVGAITIGNTTTYKGDPYDPNDVDWARDRAITGRPVWQHEKQHTYQGEQLGPLYLPSNLVGGLNAVLRGQGWHGDANWNERGPQMNPPRPWAPKAGR